MSAEKIFRDHRNDPAFDFGPVVANIAKAVEVTCHAILRRVGPKLPRELRMVVVERQTPLHRALRQRLENGDWFVDQLPRVLGDVAEVRNPGVHRARVEREAVTGLRNRLMGVGCQAVFLELARVRPRA